MKQIDRSFSEEALTSPAVDLDTTYGKALPPKKIEPFEKTHRPLSLLPLNAETAKLIKALFKTALDGLSISCTVFGVLPLLWVIDSDGTLWIALEEVYDGEKERYLWPRARGFKIQDGWVRLGHPALIDGAPGRIGGEIIYDGDAEVPGWYISNSSGRYGMRHSSEPDHLENAAKKFRELEIEISVSWQGVRGRDD